MNTVPTVWKINDHTDTDGIAIAVYRQMVGIRESDWHARLHKV
jgi:hypothetical protein